MDSHSEDVPLNVLFRLPAGFKYASYAVDNCADSVDLTSSDDDCVFPAVDNCAAFVELTSSDDESVCSLESIQCVDRAQDEEWCVDSGATSHFCNDKKLFASLAEIPVRPVFMANGAKGSVGLAGTVDLECKTRGGVKILQLTDVMFAPFLRRCFVSVTKLAQAGKVIVFRGSLGLVMSVQPEEIVATAAVKSGLYILNAFAVTVPLQVHAVQSTKVWHRRLAHLSFRGMKRLVSAVDGLVVRSDFPPCHACAETGGRRTPLANSVPAVLKAVRVLGRLCVDLKGPLTRSLHGFLYAMVVVDEHTRYVFARPL